MDAQVLQAMQRWPDVPNAYGWLALDARGRWRLYPEGDAGRSDAGAGEPITHPGIVAFIARNYAADARGCWFFQNGPQRVYVHLETGPYVLRRRLHGEGMETHTGKGLENVSRWLLSTQGRLYADSDAGPGCVDDRDLPALLEQLHDDRGRTLIEALESGGDAPAHLSHPLLGHATLLHVDDGDMTATLGFCRSPAPPAQAKG